MKNIEKNTGRAAALVSILCSALTASMVFVGIIQRLFEFSVDVPTVTGTLAFRMFTVLSNLLSMVVCLLYLPYEVDALRSNVFHAPRWIVYTSYASTTCVSITLIVSIFILSPATSFYRMLFSGSRLYLHLLAPLCTVFQFWCVNTSHRIRFRVTFLSLIPVLIYSAVYLINVVYLGEWDDQYRFNTVVPWYVSVLIILPLSFGIATLIRIVHNRFHDRQRRQFRKFYLESSEYDCPDFETAVAALARNQKGKRTHFSLDEDFTLPVHELLLLAERYRFEGNFPQVCSMYIRALSSKEA